MLGRRSVALGALLVLGCKGDLTSSDTGSETESAGTGSGTTSGTTGSDAASGPTGSGSSGAGPTTDATGSTGLATDSAGSSGSGGQGTCGDGTVDATEVCDDGRDNGLEVGACAPDCSTTIVQKRIVLSESSTTPDVLGAGTGSVVENADELCSAGYLAMFAYGTFRRATVTPLAGDQPIDWVLQPWTSYVNGGGGLLAVTDSAALLGVQDGSFSALANPIDPGNDAGVLTGMNQDFTTMTVDNCDNWSNNTDLYEGTIGSAAEVGASFIRQLQGTTSPCDSIGARPMYCVEQ